MMGSELLGEPRARSRVLRIHPNFSDALDSRPSTPRFSTSTPARSKLLFWTYSLAQSRTLTSTRSSRRQRCALRHTSLRWASQEQLHDLDRRRPHLAASVAQSSRSSIVGERGLSSRSSLITYLQFSYVLSTEVVEDLFYSRVAHYPFFSHTMPLSLNKDTSPYFPC